MNPALIINPAATKNDLEDGIGILFEQIETQLSFMINDEDFQSEPWAKSYLSMVLAVSDNVSNLKDLFDRHQEISNLSK